MSPLHPWPCWPQRWTWTLHLWKAGTRCQDVVWRTFEGRTSTHPQSSKCLLSGPSGDWPSRSESTHHPRTGVQSRKRSNPRIRQNRGSSLEQHGGGGGAYNAFIHTVHRGKKLTTESIRRITEEYHALPAAEMQKYKRLGELGNLAWRSGHAAFGARTRDRAPTQELPALPSQPGGALPQHDRAEAEANLALSRIPLAAFVCSIAVVSSVSCFHRGGCPHSRDVPCSPCIYIHTHRRRASKPSSVRAPIYPRPPGTPSATQPSTCPKPKRKFEATLALAIS